MKLERHRRLGRQVAPGEKSARGVSRARVVARSGADHLTRGLLRKPSKEEGCAVPRPNAGRPSAGPTLPVVSLRAILPPPVQAAGQGKATRVERALSAGNNALRATMGSDGGRRAATTTRVTRESTGTLRGEGLRPRRQRREFDGTPSVSRARALSTGRNALRASRDDGEGRVVIHAHAVQHSVATEALIRDVHLGSCGSRDGRS